MDEEDKALYCTAADVLEDLLQSVAEWTAKYEEARDRCNFAEKQLFFMENLVRCGNCKYWHEVDDVDGTTFGECKRPHPIIRKHIFLNSGWYCADGERKDGETEKCNTYSLGKIEMPKDAIEQIIKDGERKDGEHEDRIDRC